MNRVLITGARAPVALHLARLFSDSGMEVILADTLTAPLARWSPACARYVQLPKPDVSPDAFADALAALVAETAPTLVVPTCEEVFYVAWAFAQRPINTRLLAPSFDRLAHAHNKAQFAEDALAFGLEPPASWRVNTIQDLEKLKPQSRDLVFKPEWSRFGTSTLIRPSATALEPIVPTPISPWVAQEFVAGEELCAYAVATEGRVAALSIYRPTYRAGMGAGIFLKPVHDEAIAADVGAYVSATCWNGQISFDFCRDTAGRPRVLECNPRTTSGVHFFGKGSSLPGSMLAGAPCPPTVSHPLMIPAAMWVYSLKKAIREGQLKTWWQDYSKARDALSWPGDRLPLHAQPLSLWELARHAWRDGTSLLAASTKDIAWNGAAMSPASATSEREG
ncbi:MAG: hypothetical protein GY948_00850 [Alphaproteobacteria bacterium]|nr:hypothetical protein [Alphaproteobacteria bacterium]